MERKKKEGGEPLEQPTEFDPAPPRSLKYPLLVGFPFVFFSVFETQFFLLLFVLLLLLLLLLEGQSPAGTLNVEWQSWRSKEEEEAFLFFFFLSDVSSLLNCAELPNCTF